MSTDLLAPSARSHPRRAELDCYPVTSMITSRYADMDLNGHLNNLALETMHENIRATLNSRLFPHVYEVAVRDLRLLAAQHVVHFLAEAHWPATICAAIGVGRVGRTSYVVGSALFVDETCVSICDTVLVVAGEGGPTPIPEDARARMDAVRLRPE